MVPPRKHATLLHAFDPTKTKWARQQRRTSYGVHDPRETTVNAPALVFPPPKQMAEKVETTFYPGGILMCTE